MQFKHSPLYRFGIAALSFSLLSACNAQPGQVPNTGSGPNAGAPVSGPTALPSASPQLPGSGTATPTSPTPPASSPQATASPASTVEPSTEPSTEPSASPQSSPADSRFPGDSASLSRLEISPSRIIFDEKGEEGTYFVQAIDAAGKIIDPARLSFSWSTDKPAIYQLSSEGASVRIKVLQNSGFATLTVSESSSGLKATASLILGSSGDRNGGARPASPEPSPLEPSLVLTEPVVDSAGFTYSAGSDQQIHAFDAEGNEVWSYDVGETITGHLTAAHIDRLGGDILSVDPAGRTALYFGTDAGKLYRLIFAEGNAGGAGATLDAGYPLQLSDSAITSSPTISENVSYLTHGGDTEPGMVLVGDADGMLYARNFNGTLTDGTLLFGNTLVSDEPVLTSPIYYPESFATDDLFNSTNALVNTQDGHILMLDGGTNEEYYQASSRAFVASPSGLEGGYAIMPNLDGRLYVTAGALRVPIRDREPVVDELFLGDVAKINLGAPLRNSATGSPHHLIYVPVENRLAVIGYSEPDEDPYTLLDSLARRRDLERTVCPAGKRVVGAPLVTVSPGQEIVSLTCNDGSLHRLFYDIEGEDLDFEHEDVLALSGNGADLAAGPVFVRSQDKIAVAGPDGKMQLFAATGEDSPNESDPGIWSDFRYDPFNSGNYSYRARAFATRP